MRGERTVGTDAVLTVTGILSKREARRRALSFRRGLEPTPRPRRDAHLHPAARRISVASLAVLVVRSEKVGKSGPRVGLPSPPLPRPPPRPSSSGLPPGYGTLMIVREGDRSKGGLGFGTLVAASPSLPRRSSLPKALRAGERQRQRGWSTSASHPLSLFPEKI